MTPSATNTQIIPLCTFLVWWCCYCFAAKHNITTGESIKDDATDYLESPGNIFRMGFFSPDQNTKEPKRYVGIWYTKDPKTVVWVANRDKPVRDLNGVLMVSYDGSVKLLNGAQTEYFSTNTVIGPSSRALKLLDSGNAVLIDVASGHNVWQSFETPTDTFLLGMASMGENLNLTSWKGDEDPGSGGFVFRLDPDTNRYCIFDESETYYWKSGKTSLKSFDENQIFPQAYQMLLNTPKKRSSTFYKNNTISNYEVSQAYSRLVMSYTGHIQYFNWSQRKGQWVLHWQEPKDNCSVYRVCGIFGLCTQNKDPCKCLPGFERISHDDYKDGCKSSSGCSKIIDTFQARNMISIDDPTRPFFKADSESKCIEKCLKECDCVAYSYISQNNEGISDVIRNATQGGCWIWDSSPNNLRENGSHNISFRIYGYLEGATAVNNTPSVNGDRDRDLVLILAIVVPALVLSSLCGIGYISYKSLVDRRKKYQQNIEFQSNNTRRRINELLDLDDSKDDKEGIDVPYLDFESIIVATDGFSEKNKLGQGGFGPVYKGHLPGGQEIAVKKLSSLSGQGLQEFKNEVMLIAKLQHRNLVRLVGYCITGEEKILLYEYMPNRSLDIFIFDRMLCTSLDWERRFNIIKGISKGLNYLHHDSRLRVIHRDLKTSNILLDEDMNPKISDFGLAKIVQGNEMEAITNRVIGTFGYMSPEYALDGLFSVKSDVFSFGVVMLEIVSGKRNTGFYQSRRSTSLLQHAWNLWKEDKPFELMDQILMESCNSSEVLKCILIGLLCVQGEPDDRPNMTNIILMLAGDIVTLPTPKEPAFISRRDYGISSSSSSSKTDMQSRNMLTITNLDGR